VAKLLGLQKKKSGLAAVLSFATRVEIKKQSFKKRGWWRLKNVEAMLSTDGFVAYAAADAWATWLAMRFLVAAPHPPPVLRQRGSGSEEPGVAGDLQRLKDQIADMAQYPSPPMTTIGAVGLRTGPKPTPNL